MISTITTVFLLNHQLIVMAYFFHLARITQKWINIDWESDRTLFINAFVKINCSIELSFKVSKVKF